MNFLSSILLGDFPKPEAHQTDGLEMSFRLSRCTSRALEHLFVAHCKAIASLAMQGFTLVHIFLGFLLYLTLCPRLHLPNKASALQGLIQALPSRTQAITDLRESNGLHDSLDHQSRDLSATGCGEVLLQSQL